MADFDESLRKRYAAFPYADISELIARAEGARIPVSRASDVSEVAKIPLKTRDLLQVALHRAVELSKSFIVVFNAELFVPLFVLSRAVLETGCLSWDLWHRVEALLATRDKAALSALDTHLMNALLGAKTTEWVGDPSKYPAPNVLTIIDRLTKAEHPKLRGFYEVLCEYAHPNYAGMQAIYRVPDPVARESRFVPLPFHEEAGARYPFRWRRLGFGDGRFRS